MKDNLNMLLADVVLKVSKPFILVLCMDLECANIPHILLNSWIALVIICTAAVVEHSDII